MSEGPFPGLTLEERVTRLENVLYSLGEALMAGTTEGSSGWTDRPPTSPRLADGELDTILYSLGEALITQNPTCPPWCGKSEPLEQPPEDGDEPVESA